MNDSLQDCSSAILAGGENKRMPVLKAFIEVGGRTIIEKNLRIMRQLFTKIFIVTNQPEAYVYPGVLLLGDAFDVRGPMTGIVTALLNASTPWVFVSACDMPFINADLIKHMASKRKNSDAVVPVVQRGKEPLFAWYSKRLLGPMEKALRAGKTGLKDFLSDKRVNYIKTVEIIEIDPEAASFINLNTPDDIALYLQPEDKRKFERKAARRGKCLVLEQQS